MDLSRHAITPGQCTREILRPHAPVCVRGVTERMIRDAYAHVPRSREWTAAYLRELAAFFFEVG